MAMFKRLLKKEVNKPAAADEVRKANDDDDKQESSFPSMVAVRSFDFVSDDPVQKYIEKDQVSKSVAWSTNKDRLLKRALKDTDMCSTNKDQLLKKAVKDADMCSTNKDRLLKSVVKDSMWSMNRDQLSKINVKQEHEPWSMNKDQLLKINVKQEHEPWSTNKDQLSKTTAVGDSATWSTNKDHLLKSAVEDSATWSMNTNQMLKSTAVEDSATWSMNTNQMLKSTAVKDSATWSMNTDQMLKSAAVEDSAAWSTNKDHLLKSGVKDTDVWSMNRDQLLKSGVKDSATWSTNKDQLLKSAVKDTSDVWSTDKDELLKRGVKHTMWSTNVYQSWVKERKEHFKNLNTDGNESQNIPSLDNIDVDGINHWLSRFAVEVRKRDGNNYRHEVLYTLFYAINRTIQEQRPEINLFQTPALKPFQDVFDKRIKKLQEQQVLYRKRGDPIPVNGEARMWHEGVLGTRTPDSVINTLLFLTSKLFSLRGGQEQRDLTHDRFQFVEQPDGMMLIKYSERQFKANEGGMKRRRKVPKIIEHWEDPLDVKSFTFIYNFYLSKCPANVGELFYLKPRPPWLSASEIWFEGRPLGKNMLHKLAKEICSMACRKHCSSNDPSSAIAMKSEPPSQNEEMLTQSDHCSVEGTQTFTRRDNGDETKVVSDVSAASKPGFICPSCYWGFLTAEDLQQHWEKEHGDGVKQNTSAVLNNGNDSSKIWNQKTGSLLSDEETRVDKDQEISLLDTTLKDLEEKSSEVVALQREINDINAALKEEKWYSTALKEEVDKLETEKQERLEAYQKLEEEKHSKEIDLQEKLIISEQDKVKELDRMKEELVQALEARSGTQEEQLSLVQRSSEINTELMSVQGKLKEQEQRRSELEKECEQMKGEINQKTKSVQDLETELAQRPTADHVLSLQSHITSLEEQLKTTKNDSEREKQELKGKYQVSLETARSFEVKVNELVIEKSSKVEQIQSLQAALETASDYRKQVEGTQSEKQQQILSMQHELEQTKVAVKEKEQFVDFLQKQLEETKGNYQTELNAKDEANQEVRRLQNQLEEQKRQNESRESKLFEMEKTIVQSRSDIARMEEERNDLIRKIEAGEGISTAINQLNQEKDQLEQRLVDYESQLETQGQESAEKVEQLHQRNNKITEELEQVRANETKLALALNEKSDELSNVNAILSDTRAELGNKSEALVAVEAAKATEKAVLEEQRLSTQDTLQQKIAELSGLQQEHIMLKEQLTTYKDDIIKLQSEVTTHQSELEGSKKQCSELREENKNQSVHLESLTKEHNEMQTKSQETNHTSSEEIASLKHKQEQLISEFSCKISNLEQEKLQVEVKLEALSKSSKEKDEEFTILQAQLTKLAEEKGAVQEKLDNNLQVLQERSSQLERKSSELELVKESLQTEASTKDTEHKTQLSELMSSLKSLKEKLDTSELAHEEKTKEIEDVKSQVDQLQNSQMAAEEQARQNEQSHSEELQLCRVGIEETNATLEERSKECENLKENLEKKDMQLQDLRQKIEAQEQKLQKPCESCKDYDTKLCRMQEALNQEKQQVSLKEKEVCEAKDTIQSLLEEIAQKVTELEEGKANTTQVEQRLASDIRQLNEEKSTLETLLSSKNGEVDEQKASCGGLVKEKEILQEALLSQEAKYRELDEIKSSLEENIRSLDESLASERQEKENMTEKMAGKEKLLIGQKLEIQNQLKTMEENLAKAQEDLNDTREASKRAQGLLKTEMDGLSEKLQSEKDEVGRLKQNLQDTESRLSIKLAAANENVSSARNELNKRDEQVSELQDDIAQMEKQHFDLKGEIAVLEATIQNNHDEKRSLLERCIAAEENGEKSRRTIDRLNKQVEDLNSAMIDLGQENQNLQVVQSKRSNRKWEDDKIVTQCNGCTKKFSVSSRKHHCRNCGSIFCGDCTSKTATVAASKKPARVCEPCYNELNLPVRSYSLNSSNST